MGLMAQVVAQRRVLCTANRTLRAPPSGLRGIAFRTVATPILCDRRAGHARNFVFARKGRYGGAPMPPDRASVRPFRYGASCPGGETEMLAPGVSSSVAPGPELHTCRGCAPAPDSEVAMQNLEDRRPPCSTGDRETVAPPSADHRLVTTYFRHAGAQARGGSVAPRAASTTGSAIRNASIKNGSTRKRPPTWRYAVGRC